VIESFVDGDRATLGEVLDASVPSGAEFLVVLAEGAEPTVGGTDARGGQTSLASSPTVHR